MSEVKRFKVGLSGQFNRELQPIDAVVVLASDFDAQRLRADTAEAERDALRDKLELAERDRLAAERRYEEMATARDCIATNYNQLSYGASICKEKLADAEQRIARLTDVERVTMAILGKDKDPSPGVNWNVHRMWRVNDVRELVSAALNQKSEGESQ